MQFFPIWKLFFSFLCCFSKKKLFSITKFSLLIIFPFKESQNFLFFPPDFSSLFFIFFLFSSCTPDVFNCLKQTGSNSLRRKILKKKNSTSKRNSTSALKFYFLALSIACRFTIFFLSFLPSFFFIQFRWK